MLESHPNSLCDKSLVILVVFILVGVENDDDDDENVETIS
eukprot:CAMPEP_0114362842 /NCGR_PEP_ID=MMETSP0101-20121206/26012_1 /TAXON_ID=38822 ORGANISM="Pteridomonas danica, Strain PT" /NCGR_SAMPLE_ID=MMETSP0101 /ASSEMBLY_ACC=CAM_ASM_000211 /LENGTH=39 /DNA_ID= /DNA_START= /DNA_END= /DNA_ORIENTATION=